MSIDYPNREIIRLARTGDDQAIAALINGHLDELVGYVARRLPPYLKDQAEEVVHLALLKAWEKIRQFEWSAEDPGAGFRGWLFALVRSQFKDWLNKVNRRKRLEGKPTGREEESGGHGETPGFEDSPSRKVRQDERENLLHQALAALDNKEQLAVRLRYFDKLSAVDAAAVMRTSAGNVRQLCSRALKKLREQLGRASQFFSDK